MEIRIAEPKDAADLAGVHADTWVATYVGNVPDDVASVRVARARDRDWTSHTDLRRQLGGGVWVLVDNDSVVGFCEFGPTEDEDDDPSQVGHIMRIFIRLTFQGRGGGKLLMAAACEEMARRGFASATLWTPEDQWNHRALDFYRDLGWVPEEVRAPGGDIRHRCWFAARSWPQVVSLALNERHRRRSPGGSGTEPLWPRPPGSPAGLSTRAGHRNR